MPAKEYVGLSQINGPLVFVQKPTDVGYNEVVEIMIRNEKRLGQVVQISDQMAMIQVFEGTNGLTIDKTRVKFLGKPLMIKVSDEMLGSGNFNG